MKITCGVDWAEAHHDVALVDEGGVVIARARIDTGATGFSNLLALIGEHGGSIQDTPVALETDKNLLVVALSEAGFTVYPINPRAVARYRERHGQAGGKSDPGDAAVLAHILRTDQHMHRALPVVSEQGRAVKVLARQHQEAIWALHQAISRLRSALLEFYPQALQAFPNLKHRAALTVLAAAPTPAAASKLTRARVVALLKKSGRGNHPALVEQILADLRAPALRQPARVEDAYGHAVAGLIGTVVALQQAVDNLETEMGREFDTHPQAPILRSVPGLGPILAARVLGEIGDDPERFTEPGNLRAYAGTAPVTIASGRSHYVKARKVRNKRLGDACHWWAFAMLTKSAGARAHYDRRRAAGDHHNAALRNLANKLLGRLWWCLANNQSWDDQGAWPHHITTPETTAA
ncbi:IS110 family transposase [Mycolicibacterium pyrenivorans]|uniref:IS110 family transposase n=1 Tax=Mycolicibacterium pyrenivorans TaxID=187102 RepID=UPI0021F3C387|nr:IS110 family transposase [Mycolicibacterium pyrenivorans]MCV7153932.1 IS110 family transposase [Mycolicibacterium pyrenivorans]